MSHLPWSVPWDSFFPPRKTPWPSLGPTSYLLKEARKIKARGIVVNDINQGQVLSTIQLCVGIDLFISFMVQQHICKMKIMIPTWLGVKLRLEQGTLRPRSQSQEMQAWNLNLGRPGSQTPMPLLVSHKVYGAVGRTRKVPEELRTFPPSLSSTNSTCHLLLKSHQDGDRHPGSYSLMPSSHSASDGS